MKAASEPHFSPPDLPAYENEMWLPEIIRAHPDESVTP
jgi:hypothetical protein